jgi:hypothetical protein
MLLQQRKRIFCPRLLSGCQCRRQGVNAVKVSTPSRCQRRLEVLRLLSRCDAAVEVLRLLSRYKAAVEVLRPLKNVFMS